jgi:tetratricopeptide (TPR) repeat protein
MEKHTDPLLIDQLDNLRSGETMTGFPGNLHSDKIVAAEWEYLKLAVETVHYAGVTDSVVSVRKRLTASSSGSMQPQLTIVRSMFQNSLRIAAILIAFLGVVAIYKYQSVTASSIYQHYYTSYDLGTVRGNGTKDTLEEAYKSKDWNKVVTLYNQESSKTAKYYFLAGMADLELHQYQVAIEQFEAVLAENVKNKDHYFKDEAEYFLAFSYLMNGESGKAVRLLATIKQNKDHLYYPLTAQMSTLDLKIMDMKSKN